MTLFLQRHNFTVVYRKGSFLQTPYPEPPVKTKPSTHPCQTPSMCFTFILLAWTSPYRPLPIPFASNYAMLHHYALTCACCSITPSTVGNLLRSSYTINSKHSGTFVKNSALQMVFFLILLAPPPYLSQTKYAEQNPLMPWGSRTLPSFRSRCNFLAQHAYCQSCPGMKSKPSLSLYYPILPLHDLGSSSRKIYLSSKRSST